MGITAVLLLSRLGFLAVTAQAQDCSRPVGENMDLKGNDILLTSFPDGTTVTFACNIGYVYAGGSPSVTCTAGSWSPVRLKCQRYNCGPVHEVENGQIEYRPGTEFGDKAVLICNPGYMPLGGGELTCGSQGWMGRLPVCEAQDCSRPVGENMDLKGNDILLTSFPDGITVTFACNTGYESAGGSPSVTCTAGSWSPVRLKCQRYNCGPVHEVENGQIEYHPGTEFGDKAVLICNPGHMPLGGGELTCGSQGWLGRLPVCEEVECGDPEIPFAQDHFG